MIELNSNNSKLCIVIQHVFYYSSNVNKLSHKYYIKSKSKNSLNVYDKFYRLSRKCYWVPSIHMCTFLFDIPRELCIFSKLIFHIFWIGNRFLNCTFWNANMFVIFSYHSNFQIFRHLICLHFCQTSGGW